MKYSFDLQKRELRFIKPARTSRNTFISRLVYYVHLTDELGSTGIGECAPLKGLSIDDRMDYGEVLLEFTRKLSEGAEISELDLTSWPSIRFGLETALLQIKKGGSDVLFDTLFSRGKEAIPINGLVWMNEIASMEEEARYKLAQGFSCMKFKVGALDFSEELAMLRRIRADYQEVVFRLDANGAFTENDVFQKLEALSELRIHSIEQPVKPGQVQLMREICSQGIIPVALDEELIGKDPMEEGKPLLQYLNPSYIILKPSLLGGFRRSEQWIDLAESLNIGWWVTSALESNIGLRAIAQWTSSLPYSGHQGLGTGALYENNIGSGLQVEGEQLWHYAQEA